MKFVPNAISNKFGRQLLHLQKASPQVMFAAGVVGVVGTTVLACRSTLKLSETLEKSETTAKMANRLHLEDPDNYGAKKLARDLTVIKVRAGLDVAKLYAPAVGLGVLSIGLLTGSHVVLNKRNASMTAAYAALDKAFDEYRERVRESLGETKDRNFRYGTRTVEETVEGKDGPKTVKHTRVSDGAPSQYARFFDESCQDWQRNPEYNKLFLKAQQAYANDMLKARGHVFLNEVYDSLGIPRSQAGSVVGWVLGKGDDYIDFGIFDNLANPHVRDFVNGNEYSILLDFNVDGLIYNLI